MKTVAGGVCAAKGFAAGSIHCGIRDNHTKKDLSLIYSAVPAVAAAVYTTNLVKGAPITVTKKHLENGTAQAIICNSGNANTCNANGIEIAEDMCQLAGDALHIAAQDVVVASTGVIGQPLSIDPIRNGIPELVQSLSSDPTASAVAAEGIMTTDTVLKETAVEFVLGGKVCHMGGIAKGSGMIHPNMATMLAFITTDAAIDHDLLQKALSADIENTFNMISVDGDTSTNDMVTILANGQAENDPVVQVGEEYSVFCAALNSVTRYLCRKMAGDGEGASRLLECFVTEAADEKTAKTVARSIIHSNLFKAAMFGADANWGRVMCAIGYSGADVDVNKIDIAFSSAAGSVSVCSGGTGVPFSEEKAKEVLSEKEIGIHVSLNSGNCSATAWGCDLTYDYVKINGDYRS